LYSFPGWARGLEGVTGGKPGPVGTGWGPLGGAVLSLGWWGALGLERSIVWAGGVSGVEDDGWPSLLTSMASSLSQEASDGSASEGRRASGRRGGIGLCQHSL